MSKGSPTLLQPGRMIVTPREMMSIDPESPESARPGGSRPPTEPETPWRRGRDSNPRFRFPGTRAFQARPFNHSGTSPTNQVHDARGKECRRRGSHCLAERAGFEPAIPGRVYRFSRPALSTTQPPLQAQNCIKGRFEPTHGTRDSDGVQFGLFRRPSGLTLSEPHT